MGVGGVQAVMHVFRCSLCQAPAKTHTHTNARPTHTHSRIPAHTACPLLVERDTAQWRDHPPPGGCSDHRKETGKLPAQLIWVFQVNGTLGSKERDRGHEDRCALGLALQSDLRH